MENMEKYIVATVVFVILTAGLFTSYKCLVKMTEYKVKVSDVYGK
jgi:hypothetical protein